MGKENIPILDRAGLRHFGVVTGAAFIVIFGMAIPWLFNLQAPVWPWVVGGVLAAWGLLAPESLNPVYRGWMHFAVLLSKITTPLVLGLVYFLMFFPAALLMKALGRDTMNRSLDTESISYRSVSSASAPSDMEHPY